MLKKWLSFCVLFITLVPWSVHAALSNVPEFAQTPKGSLVQIANADGTTSKVFITAGSNGPKAMGIACTKTDGNAYTIQFNKGDRRCRI